MGRYPRNCAEGELKEGVGNSALGSAIDLTDCTTFFCVIIQFCVIEQMTVAYLLIHTM